VLAGETLLVRFHEDDQDPNVVLRNRGHQQRDRLRQEYELGYPAAHPEGERPELTKEQKAATKWTAAGLRFRLRLDSQGLECSLDEVLALNPLQPRDRVVIFPRWTEDERLPFDQRSKFTPTPRQMLYGMRADVAQVSLERDEEGKVTSGVVELEIAVSRQMTNPAGYVFGAFERPFQEGELYTLDSDPNSWHGYYCGRVVKGLLGRPEPAGPDTLYDRFTGQQQQIAWPEAAAAAQQRFLAGLDAFWKEDLFHEFEVAKRNFISTRGDAPLLLVQGPPGTGKSYST